MVKGGAAMGAVGCCKCGTPAAGCWPGLHLHLALRVGIYFQPQVKHCTRAGCTAGGVDLGRAVGVGLLGCCTARAATLRCCAVARARGGTGPSSCTTLAARLEATCVLAYFACASSCYSWSVAAA